MNILFNKNSILSKLNYVRSDSAIKKTLSLTQFTSNIESFSVGRALREKSCDVTLIWCGWWAFNDCNHWLKTEIIRSLALCPFNKMQRFEWSAPLTITVCLLWWLMILIHWNLPSRNNICFDGTLKECQSQFAIRSSSVSKSLFDFQ